MVKDAFFYMEQRAGHWWFISPEGAPFFSIGMNHLDSATLRTLESGDVWRTKYGNSQQQFPVFFFPGSNLSRSGTLAQADGQARAAGRRGHPWSRSASV